MKFVANWTFCHDGKTFEAGETVDVSAEVAEAAGAVLSPVAKAAKPSKADAKAEAESEDKGGAQ
jgi:hypothetical protein